MTCSLFFKATVMLGTSGCWWTKVGDELWMFRVETWYSANLVQNLNLLRKCPPLQTFDRCYLMWYTDIRTRMTTAMVDLFVDSSDIKNERFLVLQKIKTAQWNRILLTERRWPSISKRVSQKELCKISIAYCLLIESKTASSVFQLFDDFAINTAKYAALATSFLFCKLL